MTRGTKQKSSRFLTATATARVLGVALVAMLPVPIYQAAAADPQTVSASRTLQIEVSGGRLVRLPTGASTVFVADPTIADVQAPNQQSAFVFGKKPGQTTLFFLGSGGAPIASFILDVRFPDGQLRKQLRADAGDLPVTLDYAPNGAMLGGDVPDAASAERLMQTATRTVGPGIPLANQLQVTAPLQVSLHVRVAEVDRSVSRQLGFNWSTMLGAGSFIVGLQTGRFTTAGSTVVSNGLDAVFGSVSSKHVDATAALDAMSSEGLVSMLAEPNLTTISGTTATFLAGGEIPIPIPQALGVTSVEYKQYGVSLAFTPTVLSSGRISIKVRPEVSQIDPANSVAINGGTLLALTARRAETTVELTSGQSFAIAGLIQNSVTNNVQKLPWLGDLPVLGALFRSNQFQRQQTELVIVVSPYVVRPTGPDTPPTDPTELVKAPSDLQTLVYGPAAVGGTSRGDPLHPPHVPDRAGFLFE